MTGKNTKPHSARKSGKKARRKEQRRIEAEERQQKYDLLSDEEKEAQRELFKLRYLEQKGSWTWISRKELKSWSKRGKNCVELGLHEEIKKNPKKPRKRLNCRGRKTGRSQTRSSERPVQKGENNMQKLKDFFKNAMTCLGLVLLVILAYFLMWHFVVIPYICPGFCKPWVGW